MRSDWDDTTLVAGREVRARVRERSFVVSTLISLAVIVAIAVVPTLLDDGPSTWEIGAVGADAGAAAAIAADVAPSERGATVRDFSDDAAARRAVAAGDVDVAVAGDGSMIGREDVDDDLASALAQAWTSQRLGAELRQQGMTADEVAAATAFAPPAVELLEPPDEEQDRRVGFAAVGSILLFMQLIGFGYWVAMSIVDDKTSQVVEVLLAKVRPRSLLAGKVMGIGLIGALQLVAFVAVGLGAFTIADRFPVPPGVWPLAGVVVGAFLVAYALYAALFAIAGALAARVEDLQTTAGPCTFVMTGAYLGAIASLADPAGTWSRWLSYVPFSSPLVMPIRLAHGSAAAWELVVATIIALATAGVLVVLADRVYRHGALRLRRATKLRHALRPEI